MNRDGFPDGSFATAGTPEYPAEGGFGSPAAGWAGAAEDETSRFPELPGRELRAANWREMEDGDLLPEAHASAEGIEAFDGGADLLGEAYESARGVECFGPGPAGAGLPYTERTATPDYEGEPEDMRAY